MNHDRPGKRRRAAGVFSWAAAVAALLSVTASCSSVTGLFKAAPESKPPVQETGEQKRIPLPPLIEDFQE
ncbi:MAG: hypothetical protein V1792_25205 [Pseudomonadota bacterium]